MGIACEPQERVGTFSREAVNVFSRFVRHRARWLGWHRDGPRAVNTRAGGVCCNVHQCGDRENVSFFFFRTTCSDIIYEYTYSYFVSYCIYSYPVIYAQDFNISFLRRRHWIIFVDYLLLMHVHTYVPYEVPVPQQYTQQYVPVSCDLWYVRCTAV